MSISFTIGGVDYSTVLEMPTVEITEGLPARSDSMSFTVSLTSTMVLSTGPRPPESGQIVSIMVNGKKEFEGPITTIQRVPRVSLYSFDYNCVAVDYTKFLDKKLVVKTALASDFAGAMARQLVDEYAPDFEIGNIQSGFAIPEQSFDYEPLSNVLDKLAQSVGYSWYVDYDKGIHFFSALDEQAPITEIDVDSDVTIGNITWQEDSSRIKNRIFIKDATVRSSESRTDHFTADGTQSFFPLFSPAYDHEDIVVEVNGETVDVRPDPLTNSEGDIEGGDGLCFSCIINQGIRFGSGSVPALGDLVDVTYNPTQQGEFVDVVEDLDSIRMLASRENSNGIYEHVISLPEFRVRDMSPLHSVAMLVLDRMAWPVLSGQLETYIVQGWKAGQSFTLTSANSNLFDVKTKWKTGVQTSPIMYVQSVTKTLYTTSSDDILIKNVVQFSNIVSEVAF